MRDGTEVRNAFELVVLAGARTRQLLQGCPPRTEGSQKPARLAALEVTRGHVRSEQTPDEEQEERWRSSHLA